MTKVIMLYACLDNNFCYTIQIDNTMGRYKLHLIVAKHTIAKYFNVVSNIECIQHTHQGLLITCSSW